jgi:hypothetical protein
MVARMVLDGSINGPAFQAYVEQVLVPELKRADIIVMETCGRIWTPPDCNSRLDLDQWSQLLTYIRLREAAGQRLRREPRWVFTRFRLKPL